MIIPSRKISPVGIRNLAGSLSGSSENFSSTLSLPFRAIHHTSRCIQSVSSSLIGRSGIRKVHALTFPISRVLTSSYFTD